MAFAFYPDWPAPGYYDVLVSGVQELIAGTKTPSEMLDFIADALLRIPRVGYRVRRGDGSLLPLSVCG